MTHTERLQAVQQKLADLHHRREEAQQKLESWLRTRFDAVQPIAVLNLTTDRRETRQAVDGTNFAIEERQHRQNIASLDHFILRAQEEIIEIKRLIPDGRRVSVFLPDTLMADGKPCQSRRTSLGTVTNKCGPHCEVRLASKLVENGIEILDLYAPLNKVVFLE